MYVRIAARSGVKSLEPAISTNVPLSRTIRADDGFGARGGKGGDVDGKRRGWAAPVRMRFNTKLQPSQNS